MPKQGAVQHERLQVPQLDGLVSARGGQLLAVWGDQALQDVRRVRTQLVQRLKVRGVCPSCRVRQFNIHSVCEHMRVDVCTCKFVSHVLSCACACEFKFAFEFMAWVQTWINAKPKYLSGCVDRLTSNQQNTNSRELSTPVQKAVTASEDVPLVAQ